ncbi:uncharacterized protein LY89DRAFT_786512 [Mollisia scopiformis]|uniref:2EXR domain-containing protein n=1 Tax=Mollisia scopiformis TaxID=149040 RepID=A0A194WUI9_MOLSC|nr:uncharacterized protein LY89DRAFT_786512 [Mollisia scopiformis]KUJ11620.1 hypothetical protein LY89DRAFT_786512 [Mollisia scopiformis]
MTAPSDQMLPRVSAPPALDEDKDTSSNGSSQGFMPDTVGAELDDDEIEEPMAQSADENENDELDNEFKLSSFTCFAELPIELRQQIWKQVCFIPRNIDLFCGFTYSQRDEKAQAQLYKLFATHQLAFRSMCGRKVPPILHTSKEARSEGQKYYKVGFGKTTENDIGGMLLCLKIPPRIYVNWDCDIIIPTEGPFVYGAHDGMRPKMKMYRVDYHTLASCYNIRHLAVPYAINKKFLKPLIETLPLQEITTFTSSQRLGDWAEPREWVLQMRTRICSGFEFIEPRQLFQSLKHEREYYGVKDLDPDHLIRGVTCETEQVENLVSEVALLMPSDWKPPKVSFKVMKILRE